MRRLCCSRRRSDESPTREQRGWTSQCFFCVSLIFSKYPFLVLFTTIIFSCMITWLGINSYGLPEFEDPYLGFETRNTKLSKRLTAMNNLRHEFERQGLVESYPGQYLTSREIRKKRGFDTYCSKDPAEEYSRVALELEQNADLFSLDVLKRICYYEKLLENIEAYPLLCEKDGHGSCCPTWSLPSYIAIYANVSSCSAISKEDVQQFFGQARICAPIYANETTRVRCYTKDPSCPEFCKYSIIKAAITYTIERTHFSTNSSKYTMIILPIPKRSRMGVFLEDMQESIMDISLPDNLVSLGGFDFGNKDELFKDKLISDLQYMIMASVLIFVIVCVYTKSFFVTIVSFGALTLSLGVSYFFYNSIFKIPYFPFMNMLVTIIVLGIGTDGTLIFSVAWRRCRSNLKDEPFDKHLKLSVMLGTLKETTSTLFITTLTTAGAFFASLTSSVTTIRCFSIFAGTTIIISFILLYLCVPTALLASDIIWLQLSSLYSEEEKGPCLVKFRALTKKFKSLHQYSKNVLCPLKFNKIIKTLTTTKLAIVSFLLFSGVLFWGIYEVFYYPGFELPNSEQFQLLSYSHPAEKFDRDIERRFNLIDSEVNPHNKITLYFIWGVQDIDTGASYDPNDHGVLQFDKNFTLAGRQHQKWMRKFCKRLKKQPFYDLEGNAENGAHFDSCFLLSFIKWMKQQHCDPYTGSLKLPSQKPCCRDSKFPYNQRVFAKCASRFARYINRTPPDLFRPDIAGPKFITIKQYKIESKSTTTGSTTTKTIVDPNSKDRNVPKFDFKLPVIQNINVGGVNKNTNKDQKYPLAAITNTNNNNDDDEDDEEEEEEEGYAAGDDKVQVDIPDEKEEGDDDYDYEYQQESSHAIDNTHIVTKSLSRRSVIKNKNTNNNIGKNKNMSNNTSVGVNSIPGESVNSIRALKQGQKKPRGNNKGIEKKMPEENEDEYGDDDQEDELNAADDLIGDLATFTLRAVTNITASLSYEKNSRFFNSIERFFQKALKKAPVELQRGFVITSSLEFFDLQNSLLNDTWHSLLLSTGLCFILIWISSRSFVSSFGAVLCILSIVVVSSAILIAAFSWKLGVFESIAVTVAVGLSDFTAHHSIEFAKRKSIMEMTSPTFVSALTTIIMGLSMMLFSEVLVYQQIGSFFFVLICTSWLYSVFFLSPLLLLFNLVVNVWCPKVLGYIWSWVVRNSQCLASTKSRNVTRADPQHPSSSAYSAVAKKSCECAIEEPCDCELEEKKNAEKGAEAPNPGYLTVERMKQYKKIAQETPV